MKDDQHHPAPDRDKLSSLAASFLLYTGPLAWLVQICAGMAMTSWPCFSDVERRTAPLPDYAWTPRAALALLVVCAVLAAATGLLSWYRYLRVRNEGPGGHDVLVEHGHGRTRYLMLWAVYLGTGFTLATLVTLAGFAMVPPCLG
jgi:hypothetical protein